MNLLNSLLNSLHRWSVYATEAITYRIRNSWFHPLDSWIIYWMLDSIRLLIWSHLYLFRSMRHTGWNNFVLCVSSVLMVSSELFPPDILPRHQTQIGLLCICWVWVCVLKKFSALEPENSERVSILAVCSFLPHHQPPTTTSPHPILPLRIQVKY